MKAMRPIAKHAREALTREPIADSYRASAKLHEPAHCPSCGAAYHRGRWTWTKQAPDSVPSKCPACARIEDDLPAGYVTLRGRFVPAHRDEIIAVVKAREARARAEHPLQRIMEMRPGADAIVVTTTDIHLARGIARAVRDAFAGELKLRYSRDEDLLRAEWSR